MAELAVGATIWRFDENHRVYAKDRRGPPIYREHWVPVNVVGENRRSWLCGYETNVRWKVPKTGPHRGFAFSLAEVDDDCWVNAHRADIGLAVHRVKDAAVLRKIAALIGWAPGSAK